MKKRKFYNIILPAITCFVLLSSLFLFGSFSDGAVLEEKATYMSNVVVKQSNKGSLISVNVEKKDKSTFLEDPCIEFYNTYGVFKQRKITFACSVNSDRQDHDICIENGISENLALVYLGPIGSIEYNGHYKHYIWPMELMFMDDGKSYETSNFLAYISQDHADKILELNGVLRHDNGLFDISDYEELLFKPLNIFIDGKPEVFSINNIYFKENYYFEGLNEVLGDFVMTSYYLPGNLAKERENMYFMSEYSYQNLYFMKYIKATYKSRTHDVHINHFNISGSVDDSSFLSFFYNDNLSKHNWLFVCDVVFVIACFLIYAVFAFKKRSFFNGTIPPVFVVSVITYLLFWVINISTKSSMFFSAASCKIYYCLFLVFFILIVLKYIFRQKKAARTYQIYEVNI